MQLGSDLQVLDLLPCRVQRERDLVAFGHEPHLGQLRVAVVARGGQGGELAVEEVAVALGDAVLCHAPGIPSERPEPRGDGGGGRLAGADAPQAVTTASKCSTTGNGS